MSLFLKKRTRMTSSLCVAPCPRPVPSVSPIKSHTVAVTDSNCHPWGLLLPLLTGLCTGSQPHSNVLLATLLKMSRFCGIVAVGLYTDIPAQNEREGLCFIEIKHLLLRQKRVAGKVLSQDPGQDPTWVKRKRLRGWGTWLCRHIGGRFCAPTFSNGDTAKIWQKDSKHKTLGGNYVISFPELPALPPNTEASKS